MTEFVNYSPSIGVVEGQRVRKSLFCMLLGNMKFSIFPLDSCWRIILQKRKQGSASVTNSHGIDSTQNLIKSTCYITLYGTIIRMF